MINWQRLLLPLFTVRQYLFCANSIVCYSFKTRPNIPVVYIIGILVRKHLMKTSAMQQKILEVQTSHTFKV